MKELLTKFLTKFDGVKKLAVLKFDLRTSHSPMGNSPALIGDKSSLRGLLLDWLPYAECPTTGVRL
jgi:hypothetical protein